MIKAKVTQPKDAVVNLSMDIHSAEILHAILKGIKYDEIAMEDVECNEEEVAEVIQDLCLELNILD